MKFYHGLKFFFSFNVKRNKNHHPIKNSVFVAAISAAYPQKGIFTHWLDHSRTGVCFNKAFFVYGSRASP
jgi:hypothetical protein